MKKGRSFYLLFLLLPLTFTAQSAFSKLTGLEVARKVEKANDNFKGEKSDMEMALIDAHGSKVTRLMSGKTLEVLGDGDKSLIVFKRPKDVEGTKMLTWSKKEGDDLQWLYLPSFRRVKRITSRGKSGSFMASEFSFEDLGSQEVEKYSYKLLKEDSHPVFGKAWVLERLPKIKSGYSKQKVWIGQKYMSAYRIEYYDRKQELLKVAEISGFDKFTVKGKVMYRAKSIHMKNKQTKKQSIFTWKSRTLGQEFKSNEFSKNRLKL